MSRKAINEATDHLKSVPEHEERALLATGRFIGEGFDDARLDTLFLTLPVSWRGTIAQYVGRLHRLHDLKKEVQVYDYADLGDAKAYRSDRRKDVLLQENGYMVLRFLAEDVGKHLDDILDSILRALSRSDH